MASLRIRPGRGDAGRVMGFASSEHPAVMLMLALAVDRAARPARSSTGAPNGPWTPWSPTGSGVACPEDERAAILGVPNLRYPTPRTGRPEPVSGAADQPTGRTLQLQ